MVGLHVEAPPKGTFLFVFPIALSRFGIPLEDSRAMVKCPFCQYQNEDGALFCEQCKSDLSARPGCRRRRNGRCAAETMPMAALVGDGGAARDGHADETRPRPMPPPAQPPRAKLGADAKPRLVVLRGRKSTSSTPFTKAITSSAGPMKSPSISTSTTRSRPIASGPPASTPHHLRKWRAEPGRPEQRQRHVRQPDPRLPRPEAPDLTERRDPGRHRANEVEGLSFLPRTRAVSRIDARPRPALKWFADQPPELAQRAGRTSPEASCPTVRPTTDRRPFPLPSVSVFQGKEPRHMPAHTCTKCHAPIPAEAVYCYYDGVVLNGHASPGHAAVAGPVSIGAKPFSAVYPTQRQEPAKTSTSWP